MCEAFGGIFSNEGTQYVCHHPINNLSRIKINTVKRYPNLTTGAYATLSFAATLPLSMYFGYVEWYDLQSIVFSLIVGYSLSSVVLVVIVLTTNWTKCSEAVVRSADTAQEEQERLSMLKLKRKNAKRNAESDDQTVDCSVVTEDFHLVS